MSVASRQPEPGRAAHGRLGVCVTEIATTEIH